MDSGGLSRSLAVVVVVEVVGVVEVVEGGERVLQEPAVITSRE